MTYDYDPVQTYSDIAGRTSGKVHASGLTLCDVDAQVSGQ